VSNRTIKNFLTITFLLIILIIPLHEIPTSTYSRSLLIFNIPSDTSPDQRSEGSREGTKTTTILTMYNGSGIKGENVTIRGLLTDDHGNGLSGRTVHIYWKEKPPHPIGSPEGNATTDGVGKFEFDGFRIPATQPVGYGCACGRFKGDDVYSVAESNIATFVVQANVRVSISGGINNGTRLSYGDELQIKGVVAEVCDDGEEHPATYVGDVYVYAVLVGKGESRELPEANTDEWGLYEITTTVPYELEPGEYELRMCFRETDFYVTETEYLETISILLVAETYLKVIHCPPGFMFGWEEDEGGNYVSVALLEKGTGGHHPELTLSNETINMKITIWDAKGGRNIITLTESTNASGHAVFDLSDVHFVDDDGVEVFPFFDPIYGCSYRVYFNFTGNEYLTKCEDEYDSPGPQRDLSESGSSSQSDTEGLWWVVVLIGVGIVIAIVIVSIINMCRRKKK